MDYYIVIPAHNEEKYISKTLQSLVSQTILPKKVVVVNDNSTDRTANIIIDFAKNHSFITLVDTTSDTIHLPGSKVIRAFYKGFEILDDQYDIIVKLDADLILPNNYFETIIGHFENDSAIGMAGGFAYIENKIKKNQFERNSKQNIETETEWVLENLTNKDHIRGAFKAYRKACFQQIGGLKPAMGWDTVDELLCRFYNWNIITDATLKVKHLKPTGVNYNKTARYKQGEAFYSLGYGFLITAIASAKLAIMKKKPLLFIDYIKGFWKAKMNNTPLLVTTEQAQFIRAHRWNKIKEKLMG
jgi:cellulose synthase/poly-beta-1,6-N-acetylglucosamine synthase-like glycosyltransferase